jgi:hypothetical protein
VAERNESLDKRHIESVQTFVTIKLTLPLLISEKLLDLRAARMRQTEITTKMSEKTDTNRVLVQTGRSCDDDDDNNDGDIHDDDDND